MKRLAKLKAELLNLAATVAVLAAGCGADSTPSPAACQVGEAVTCACDAGDLGAKTCSGTGQWGACECGGDEPLPPCSAGSVVACLCTTGDSGVQTCVANGSWSDCECAGAGICTPGTSTVCSCPDGSSGIQGCNAVGSWDACECMAAGVCTPGAMQACVCPDASASVQACNAMQGWDGCQCVVSGTGGTGGTGGATGTGAVGGTGGTQATGGNQALLPVSGYILDTAGTGILGAWYTFGCTGASITPSEGSAVRAVDGQMCFQGTVPAVVGGDFATTYGAVIGFDLCGMPADPSFLPAPMSTWTPESRHTAGECDIQLTTISFDITGQLPPAGIDIVFKEQGRAVSPYLTVAGVGTFAGVIGNATVPADPTAPLLTVQNVESIHFYVRAVDAEPVSFNFCISQLSVL